MMIKLRALLCIAAATVMLTTLPLLQRRRTQARECDFIGCPELLTLGGALAIDLAADATGLLAPAGAFAAFAFAA